MLHGMIGNSDTDSPTDVPYDELDLECEDVLAAITDEVILGLCFEVHRAVKLNFFFLDEGKEDESRKFEIVGDLGQDIFGLTPSGIIYGCECPKCGNYLAALRFAPHLEKCLKKRGRKSFRKANEKIVNVSETENEFDEHDKHDKHDNDSDWNSKEKKGTRKKKNVKNSKKNKKPTKLIPKNGSTGSITPANGNPAVTNFDDLTHEQKKSTLMQICGVISEKSKKMCTKSIRCSNHSNKQRRHVRISTLGFDFVPEQPPDEVPIDVDTVDECLWDPISISRNTSPAGTSNVSKRKDKKLFKM